MARVSSKGKELILTVYSTTDADSACATLLKSDIEYVRRKIGAGDHGNILLAMRNFGEEIFVDPKDVDKAQEVLTKWREKMEEQQRAAEPEAPKVLSPQDNRQILLARIFGTVALVFIIAYYFIQCR